MADAPFFRGRDAVLRLFVNNKEVLINAKTWSAKPVMTKGKDDLNGEDRARPYAVLDFYEFTFTGYQRDVDAYDAWLSDVANEDTSASPLAKAASMRIGQRGKARAGYVASEITLDEFEMNQGGRTEAVMLNGGFRARYFKKVP
jgi:hypothetical protein